MASNPPSERPSGSSTPNPRFTSQTKTAEDLLSTQTVGLVNLSDFRKRRAEAIEQKERDTQELLLGIESARNTPIPDGTSPSPHPIKRKKRKLGGRDTPKLSFGGDEDEEDGDESTEASASNSKSNSTSNSPRGGTPVEGVSGRMKISANKGVGFVPKTMTKTALLREAQTRESLRKEFLKIQEAVKGTEICIPFVFYDGTNIPGGMCKVKKGDFIWVFLDRSRKVGAELGVGEKANSRREWARVGVDDLMLVRGSIIIPHHYDFYYFIINHTLGPNNRILFDYSSEPPAPVEISEAQSPEDYNPLSITSKAPAENKKLEGMEDDPTFTKVVDRRWYERNKHIFPASVWQEFDPEKDYQKEVKRDLGGNAFFFS